MSNNLSDCLEDFEKLLDLLKENEEKAPLQLRDLSHLTRVREELTSLPFLEDLLNGSESNITKDEEHQSILMRSACNFFSGFKMVSTKENELDFITIPKYIDIYNSYIIDILRRIVN